MLCNHLTYKKLEFNNNLCSGYILVNRELICREQSARKTEQQNSNHLHLFQPGHVITKCKTVIFQEFKLAHHTHFKMGP